MNQKVIYDFLIEAVSPLYFGDGQSGQESPLFQSDKGRSVIPGNALGGALREYLKQTGVPDKIILKYMGGVELGEEGEETFVTSGIYISDGKMTKTTGYSRKEGTAVNPAYGAAEKHSKYTLEHLPEETKIFFRIEGDVRDDTQENDELCAAELEKIIGTWAKGFETQRLVLGGQKSNGFGRCRLEKLEKTVFPLDSGECLKQYIFRSRDRKGKALDWKELLYYESEDRCRVVFSMEGVFPYGVYQSFDVKNADNTGGAAAKDSKGRQQLTGLLKKMGRYFIPSTSVKGLVKNEIRLLLRRIKDKALADKKLEELFGGEAAPGKVVFSDLQIEGGREVQVERYVKNEQKKWQEEQRGPIYVKIDRLTGGAYASALKHQQEIQGRAKIRFELSADQYGGDITPYIFPLIYVLRRIGTGTVPLGGRTVIGLGGFSAQKVEVAVGKDGLRTIETGGNLSEENRKQLEQWFESFKRWCDGE
ncbi:MAG: RAMP superfamily CRISPR-associated protein [Firmicutes bacterium]|nr:RAMP superfamily CRISPR-associated protein [Bacillota bacterium]